MVPHVCNPNIQENEAGGLQLGGQPDLETLSLKRKGKERKAMDTRKYGGKGFTVLHLSVV